MRANAVRPIVLFAAALIGCGGGFDDIDDPQGEGRLIGRALTAEREPVAGVSAYLVQHGVAVARTESDATGRFQLELDRIGPADVVLNDAAGRGALKAMALYAGENDAGDLFLQPLESIAPVVDMRDIGFEERLTTERGDYLHPIYDADRTTVYAARRKGGDANYQIVRIDLPGGRESVLRDDEELYSSQTSLQLLGDEVLHYVAYRTITTEQYPEGIRATHHVFIDTATGAELAAVVWWEMRAGPMNSGDSICYIEGAERQAAYDSIFGTVYEYRLRPACLAKASGQITRGDPIPGWSTNAQAVAANAERLAFLRHRECDYEDPDCQWDPPVPLFSVNWADLSYHGLGSFESDTRWVSYAAWSGEQLYFLATDQSPTATAALFRLDVTAAYPTPQRVFDFACADWTGEACPAGGQQRVSPGGERLVLQLSRSAQNGEAEHLGLYSIDLLDASSSAVDTRFVIDGEEYALCSSGEYSGCDWGFEPNGDITLGEVFTDDDGARTAVRAIIGATGDTAAWAFAIGEGDYSVPGILRSPDCTRQVVARRDLDSGFFQIHAGAPGAGTGAMEQVTFITADHHSPAFAPDSDHLYYFTRDPISGYEQLFQVSVAVAGGDPER
jgi:hypothetical protein